MSSDAWTMRRLAMGRHRAAIMLTMMLIAWTFIVPVLQAVRAASASNMVAFMALGAFLRTFEARTTSVVIGGVLTGMALRRLHPPFQPKYVAALGTLPWRAGQRLPLGDAGIGSSTVLLPTFTLLALWGIGFGHAAWMLVGLAVVYVGIGIFNAVLARRISLALAMFLLSIVVPPAIRHEVMPAVAIALLVAVLLAGRAMRSAIAAALAGEALDFKRIVNPKGSAHGWLTNLPLRPPRRDRAAEVFGAFVVGAVVLSWCLTVDGYHDNAIRGALVLHAIALGFIRVIWTLNMAMPSFNPVARVLTGRFVMPRMDHLLIVPGLLAAWLVVIAFFPFDGRSPWNAVSGALLAVGTMLIATQLGPTRLTWQTTGACRLSLAVPQTVKQAETNLKRQTGL